MTFQKILTGGVAVAAVGLLCAGCGSSGSAGGQSVAASATVDTAGSPPAATSPTPPPTQITSSVAPSSVSASAGTGSFRMPDEVGAVLQAAQDDIQRVSKDPVFVSHSHDVIKSRFQVFDRDWKVCTQNVKPGAKVSAVGHIDFGVVKTDEVCP